MGQILEEVQKTTAEQVAKKQDKAQMNFPKLVEKIKIAASSGESSVIISVGEMNEFDKQLLDNEGFKVWLIDRPRTRYDNLLYNPEVNPKAWEINW